MTQAGSPGPGGPGSPELAANPDISPEAAAGIGSVAFGTAAETPASPDAYSDVLQEALLSKYYGLEERVITNPVPTQEEMDMGVFAEEIQPQARDAVVSLRQKGYDIGNVTYAGFMADRPDTQGMMLATPLSTEQATQLAENGFVVENGHVSFQPGAEADLHTIKASWDWLAANLPDLGEPAQSSAFGNAEAFRQAASSNTLLAAYMPGGVFDPTGTKYRRDRDPHADHEMLSSKPAAAAREATFINQYHELKDRLNINPTPTAAELNMGAYVEEIESQVRGAVVAMREKGYNTGSSGFYGAERDQSMDINTPIDSASKARLAELGVEVTDREIRFTPEDPADMAAVKAKWDLVASILPDLGRHAEPSGTEGADIFRYVASEKVPTADILESWVWQRGALDGYMPPLTMALVNEGRDFGPDVYAAGREARARYDKIAAAASALKRRR